MNSLNLPIELIYLIRDFMFGTPKQIYNSVVANIKYSPMYLYMDNGLPTFLLMLTNRYSGFQCRFSHFQKPSISRIILDHMKYNKLCKNMRASIRSDRDTVVAVSDDLMNQYILRYEYGPK
jgi:hypothetical protein